MRSYSFSTSVFRDQDPVASLDVIASAGFSCIELSGHGRTLKQWNFGSMDDPPDPPSGRDAEEFRRAVESHGLRVATLHGPPRTTVLGAPTESWRTESVRTLSSHLRFASDMGAAGMVIHGIPNPQFLPQGQPIAELSPKMVEAMRRSVEDLIPVAEQTGTRLLLENLPYTVDLDEPYPLMSMHQLRPFVEEFPPEQVGLIVDTGHAWTNGDEPVSEIQTAGDRLWGTHLQDVPRENPNDNHWIPTTGELDWPAICSALDQIGYQGAWTFETIYGRDGETVPQLVRKSFEAAQLWGG